MTQQQVATVPQARTGPMPTTGRWGWYRDHEGKEFRRVSTLVKEVETDNFNLEKWKLRQVGEGLGVRDDLVLAIKAMGRPDPATGWTQQDKKKLDGIVDDAMRAAKQRDGARSGTAMHDLTERVDRGEDIEAVVRGLPALPAACLRAYAFLRRQNGWRSVEIERTVVCDDLEVAGSFDRVDLVPGLAALLGPGDCQYGCAANGSAHIFEDGHDIDELSELPVVVDVKTETSPWLNGLHIGPQLAIYSRAQRMWRPTGGMVGLVGSDGKPKTYSGSGDQVMTPAGEYVPAPCVRQDVAIVVHVFAGDAVPYFVNLAEGWEAARAAYEQANRKARAKRSLGSAGAWFVAVPNVVRPAPAQLLVEHSVAQQYGRPGPEAIAAAAAERLVPGAGVQQSYRRADGMVDWAPAEAPVGTVATVGGTEFVKVDTMANVVEHGPLDEIDRGAVRAIYHATDLAGLATVYDLYTGPQVGREWAGRVAEAGEQRRVMLACLNREAHVSPDGTANVSKCACGWDPRYAA